MGTLPASLSSVKGTYVVVVRLKKVRTIKVGKLGRVEFLPGWYAYVGSAMGPGGMRARIARHYRLRKKKHWHIDYLRSATRMEGVFVGAESQGCEHVWAQCMGSPPLSGQPVIGFGATDCGCKAHLFYFPTRPALDPMASTLRAQWISLAAAPKNR